MKQNRNMHIKVRVSEKEKSEIEAKAKSADMTVAELIRFSLKRVRISSIFDKNIERERIREIRRIGQNLNQIARWCNQHKTSAEAVEIIKHLIAVERAVDSFFLPTPSASADAREREP